jgi:probable rRNA maturation factor
MSADGPRPRRRPGPPEGTPAVFVADEQAAAPVDARGALLLAEAVLHAEGVRGASELSLYFVDERTMADLNERFMGVAGPTDVLAFPIDEDVVEGGRVPDAGSSGPDRAPPDPSEVPLLLGDVFVCPAVAARNAPTHAGTYEDEVALLVVHGILHVLGMDHADDAAAAAMQSRERDLLARFGPAADGRSRERP